MEYKVLVKLYVPAIEQNFDMYLPVNKSIGQVMSLLNKAINSETSEVFPIKNNLRLLNRRTLQPYIQEMLLRDTDIKNGTELVLI